MTLRTGLLKVAEGLRKSLREGLDQCPSQLTIIQREWSGGRVGRGTPTETVLIAFNRYLPIRQMNNHEYDEFAGRFKRDDIMVSRITPADPANPGVGFFPEQLRPRPTSNGIEIVYRIDGDVHALNGEYTCIDLRTGGRASHPGGYSGRGGVYSYALVLRRKETTP